MVNVYNDPSQCQFHAESQTIFQRELIRFRFPPVRSGRTSYFDIYSGVRLLPRLSPITLVANQSY